MYYAIRDSYGVCMCDDCGKPMSVMDYYNQEGICIACFEKWMNETDNEQEMIKCTEGNQ